MKKYIIIVLVLSLIVISCSKGNIIKTNDETTINNDNKNLKESSNNMRMLYYWTIFDEFGSPVDVIILGCWWPPDNCLPTVVISGNSQECPAPTKNAYDDFINKFTNDSVSSFFTNGNYLTLFPELVNMPDVVQGLSNSTIILHKDVGKNDSLDYYIGLPDSVDYLSNWQDLQKCVFVIDNKIH